MHSPECLRVRIRIGNQNNDPAIRISLNQQLLPLDSFCKVGGKRAATCWAVVIVAHI